MGGDHRLDIAVSWSDLALRHLETAVHPEQPDRAGEQVRQCVAAAESLAIFAPIAAALPDPDIGDADLLRMARTLDRLVSTLTHGAADSGPSVQAVRLARRVYGQLPGDRRLDIGVNWFYISLPHHEVSVHPENPDPIAERARQREAAVEGAAMLSPIAERLPDPAVTVADLRRMASDSLTRLVGLLTFGAPPGEAETAQLEASAERTRAVAEKTRQALD